MMHLHNTLPTWADYTIALPLLIIIAFSINVLTALWMQPHLKQTGGGNALKLTTLRITGFSMVAILLGALVAFWQVTPFLFVPLAIIGFAGLVILTKISKRLMAVTAGIYSANFFMGVVVITENSLAALLLAICGIVIMCVLAITILPLSSWRTR